MLETLGHFVEYEYKVGITEISRSTGISRQYLYKLVRGEVNPDKVSYGYYVRLSSVLGLDIDTIWLLIRNSFEVASK